MSVSMVGKVRASCPHVPPTLGFQLQQCISRSRVFTMFTPDSREQVLAEFRKAGRRSPGQDCLHEGVNSCGF